MLSRIFTTSLKSGLLATVLFVLLFDESMGLGSEIMFIFFLAYLIITVIAFFAILFTILFLQVIFEKRNLTDIEFVKLVFPYYVVTAFTISIAFLITDIDAFVVVIPAFAASISAWFWLFKPKSKHLNS